MFGCCSLRSFPVSLVFGNGGILQETPNFICGCILQPFYFSCLEDTSNNLILFTFIRFFHCNRVHDSSTLPDTGIEPPENGMCFNGHFNLGGQ